jgi:hypothetical protein
LVAWDIEGIVSPEQAEELSPDKEPELYDSNRERFRPLPGSDCPPIDWHTAGFHDVIGKFFQKPERKVFLDESGKQYIAPMIYYRRLDLEEGMVLSSVTRFYQSQSVPHRALPYRSQR